MDVKSNLESQLELLKVASDADKTHLVEQLSLQREKVVVLKATSYSSFMKFAKLSSSLCNLVFYFSINIFRSLFPPPTFPSSTEHLKRN